MANPPLQLVIGNYNTSSWSLRASLVLRLARLAFTEIRVPLRRPETPERIARYSPSGKLPVLVAEGVPIWDSLAIAEFTAELESSIWPIDPVRRAEARSISAEMHSGFLELRRLMPMDIVSRFNPPGRLPRGLAADIERIKTIWRRCRERYAADGPFLFGAFSVADAMFAPVATRFVTHGVPLDGLVEDFVDSLMAWPDMVAWCDAAAAEQDERARHGSLGVVERAVAGRILNGDGEPSESGREAPRPLQRALAETERSSTKPASIERPSVEPEQPPAAAAEAMQKTAPEAEEPPPVVARAEEVGGEAPPPEVNADQPAPSATSERPASIEREGERQSAPEESGRAPALPPLPPLEPKGRAERPPAVPERKLGWIRRPVPQEHLDAVAEDAPPNHPLRRAALGAQPPAQTAAKSADQTPAEPPVEPPIQPPIEPPVEPDAWQAPRPGKLRPITREATTMPARDPAEREDGGKAGQESGGSGREGQRREVPGRSPTPPVKPIGGGILRRR